MDQNALGPTLALTGYDKSTNLKIKYTYVYRPDSRMCRGEKAA